MKLYKISIPVFWNMEELEKLRKKGFENTNICYFNNEINSKWLYKIYKNPNLNWSYIYLPKDNLDNIEIISKKVRYNKNFNNNTGMLHLNEEIWIKNRKSNFKDNIKVFCELAHMYWKIRVYRCYKNNLLNWDFDYFSENELI